MSNSTDEESIFAAALEYPDPHARAEYVERVCGSDPKLRQRVAMLLSAYGEGEFLEASPHDVLATAAYGEVTERPGSSIGPYKLLEQIGEGGMGLVFMAEQTQPIRRRVALKIIKPGLDTHAVVARFEAERQALALMDHPNIARVYDAGATSTGRPYFVMELVRGIPITDYCRDHGLGLRERLELFINVCQAVQHAHQKGIIHRDLKPSNILVAHDDTRPVPKVIDFGVAKATTQQLTERTLFTHFAQLIGTPLYMSPEQAEFNYQDVDTRSDVYSLGVVLYELLTGTTPFEAERLRSAGPDEMRRIIREEDPPRPSTRATTMANAASPQTTEAASKAARRGKPFATSLKGDLDWIVMKCLEKDRRRRYESPSALGADIQRHLDREPILARPVTVATRLVKWSRRHVAAAVATGVVLMVLLMFGSAYAADRWRQIREGSAYVREAIAAATAALANDDVSQASQRLAEAATRIEANGLTSTELKSRVAELTEEAERYRKFTAILVEARKHRSEDAKGIEPAEAALDLYGVMSVPDWLKELEAIEPPEAHVGRVKEGVYELLLLKADHLTRFESVRSPKNTELATQCLEKAVTFHAPSHGYYWLLANCAFLNKEKEEEDRLRELALATAPSHAAELFYENRDRVWGTVAVQESYSFEENYRDHREMLRFDPSYYNGMFFMALRLAGEQRYEEALVAWYGCIAMNPRDAIAHLNRANSHCVLGHFSESLADFDRAMLLAPRFFESTDSAMYLNRAAWWRATLPEDALRNGRQAVNLAERACKLTNYESHHCVMTLAAAHAEAGDFTSAIKWANTGMALADSDEVRERDRALLTAFENKRPWRETPESGVGAGTRMLTAQHLSHIGELDAAVTLFNEALDELPLEPGVWFHDNGVRRSVETRVADSDELFQRLSELRPTDYPLHVARVKHLVSHQRWEELLPLLGRLQEIDRYDFRPWFDGAAVALYVGNSDVHQELCREQLDRLKDTKNPMTAERLSKICTLAPDPPDVDLMVELAERSFERPTAKQMEGWLHFAKGLAYYRAGRLEEALECAELSIDKSGYRFCKPIGLLLKAMVQHKLGLPEQAAQTLDEADQAISQHHLKFNGKYESDWHHWIRFQVLRREAERLVRAAP